MATKVSRVTTEMFFEDLNEEMLREFALREIVRYLNEFPAGFGWDNASIKSIIKIKVSDQVIEELYNYNSLDKASIKSDRLKFDVLVQKFIDKVKITPKEVFRELRKYQGLGRKRG